MMEVKRRGFLAAVVGLSAGVPLVHRAVLRWVPEARRIRTRPKMVSLPRDPAVVVEYHSLAEILPVDQVVRVRQYRYQFESRLDYNYLQIFRTSGFANNKEWMLEEHRKGLLYSLENGMRFSTRPRVPPPPYPLTCMGGRKFFNAPIGPLRVAVHDRRELVWHEWEGGLTSNYMMGEWLSDCCYLPPWA